MHTQSTPIRTPRGRRSRHVIATNAPSQHVRLARRSHCAAIVAGSLAYAGRAQATALSLALLVAMLLLPLHAIAAESIAPSQAVRHAAAVDNSTYVSSALAYIKTKQLANGGIEGFAPGTADEFTTIRAVLAIASASRPQTFMTSSGGATPIDYLATRATAYVKATNSSLLYPGRAGMLMTAVVAGDRDPRAFGGLDLVTELNATYNPTSGTFSTSASEGFSSGAAGTVNQVWSIMGLAAAQSGVPIAATNYLISLQESDGGWGYGAGGDVDLTALVVQALIASNNVLPTHPKVQEGLTFIRTRQTATGGWESYGSLSADSTAIAMQALVAAGFTPVTTIVTTFRGRTPHDELRGLQASDGGFSGNALGAADAIPGLTETAFPIPGRTQRARLALAWTASQQNANGSWNGFSGPDVGATTDAALAFVAGGYDPATVKLTESSSSALAYMMANASSYANVSADQSGKLTLAAVAMGQDPTNFGGVNLIGKLNSQFSSTNGGYSDTTNTWHQAFAILGLRAANQTAQPAAVETLKNMQQNDGGWKYDLSPSVFNVTGADSTGLAMQALIAVGEPPSSTVMTKAKAFLRSKQDARAGWSDPNTTAYAMQGLLAAGENLVTSWSKNDRTPYQALATYQKTDGPFFYSTEFASNSGLATWQAVPALLGIAYPYKPSTALAGFSAVGRGPSPDRIVTSAPRVSVSGGNVAITVPFGGDMNASATVALTWQRDGSAPVTLTTTRGDGALNATITGKTPGLYSVRAVLADSDGVQGQSDLTTFYVVNGLIRLPMIARNASAQ